DVAARHAEVERREGELEPSCEQVVKARLVQAGQRVSGWYELLDRHAGVEPGSPGSACIADDLSTLPGPGTRRQAPHIDQEAEVLIARASVAAKPLEPRADGGSILRTLRGQLVAVVGDAGGRP